MADYDYGIFEEAPSPAPKKRKATAAPSAGVDDATFQGYLADPTKLPDGKWPLSQAQKTELRSKWKILNEPIDPNHSTEAKARVGQLNQRLDRLLKLGEDVYSGKIDKKITHAVSEHFAYVKEKERRGTGERGITDAIAEKVGVGSGADPVDKLKGTARGKALAMVSLIDALRDARTGAGDTSANVSPYELLTTHLPGPKDNPDAAAKKRIAFAHEIEELAQAMPSQHWREAITHIRRARALGGETQQPNGPGDLQKSYPGRVPGTQAPNQPAGPGLTGPFEGAGEAPEMGAWEAIKRSFVNGATTLSLPTMAALAHGINQTGQVPLGEGMYQEVPEAKDESVTFGQSLEKGKQLRSEALGDVNPKETEAKLEEAGEAITPVGKFAAEVAGGFADPTTYGVGMMGKAISGAARLSPAARALLGNSVSGGLAGGIAAQGNEGQSTVKSVLVGMGLGAVLGKVAQSVLDSPAKADVIESIVKRFGRDTKATTAELAAKRASTTESALSPEVQKVTAGSTLEAEKLGPQLIDRRNAILAENKLAADSPVAKKIGEIEDAIDAGDSKAIQALRKELAALAPRKDAASAKLRKQVDELFGLREIVAERLNSGHGHGNVSNTMANAHPFATLSNSEAPLAAKAAALAHATGEGMGGRGLFAFAAGNARAGAAKVSQPMKVALAKLYLARQSGDSTAIQQATEEAILHGAPFSLTGQLASRINWEDGEE